MSEYMPFQRVGSAVVRLRKEAEITQSTLAGEAGLDQSRVSRIEKGEVTSAADVDRVLDALTALGASEAEKFKAYVSQDWQHIEPPSFWNPERPCLEIAEETLGAIDGFLKDEERPWPLRRQIEKHRETLQRAAGFLGRANHSVAFIGDMGVGKSTAISFAFDLLVPPSLVDKSINRPVLETGAGGTTICEVHITAGPEFGISLLPMSTAELNDLVSDFCAAKWALHSAPENKGGETVNVSREIERAIRNMSGLGRRRETVDGKRVSRDPIQELMSRCSSEDELRVQILGLMAIENRTQRELWYDSSTRKHPMEWITETFRAVNNGRMAAVSLPKSIDLLIPEFGKSFGELEISVIDTKGVDDVAVREDLDQRLKDPRTAIVFCSRFNDAPGTSTQALLQHMRQTFSERVDTGKVSILALPRADEARAMKDDMGEQALTDAEGYEFKQMQVEADLIAGDLKGVPVMFYNVESDDAGGVREQLFEQLGSMRKSVEERLFDLCAAAQEIIENHKAEAINAALEEVARQLTSFLAGNRELGARERLAHLEAIEVVKGVRYASTLWASTRRNGEYYGLNLLHLLGVGAARDAQLRTRAWFDGLKAFLNTLEADADLGLATRSIAQIGASAETSKRAFLEAVQRSGVEVYREPLTQSPVWSSCVGEWGQGQGFKMRVAAHLDEWFEENPELKDKLEEMVKRLWNQVVIRPLLRLGDETEPAAGSNPDNVLKFPERATV